MWIHNLHQLNRPKLYMSVVFIVLSVIWCLYAAKDCESVSEGGSSTVDTTLQPECFHSSHNFNYQIASRLHVYFSCHILPVYYMNNLSL